MEKIVGVTLALGLLGACFGLIEARWAAVPGHRARWRTDLAWWFFTPLVTRPLSRGVAAISLAPAVWALGLPRGEALIAGHGPLAALPWPIQLAIVLVLVDAIGYGMHRLHHRTLLWGGHAVHHSAEHLDWLAAVRIHPLNDWVQRAPGLLCVILAGFDLRVVAAIGPLLTLWAIGNHANVRLRLGPLAYLITTPAFHRWHHARDGAPEGGCNFSGLFPCWDLCFGTFYLPPEEASDFGIDGPGPRESFWRQLAWPIAALRR